MEELRKEFEEIFNVRFLRHLTYFYFFHELKDEK
jgi:hypothetical protein